MRIILEKVLEVQINCMPIATFYQTDSVQIEKALADPLPSEEPRLLGCASGAP